MGKTLRSDIIIGGKADPSFYQLGNQIGQLGAMLNQLSGKLIEFGEESVDAYKNYEDYLLDTQVALKTQYEGASELGKVMNKLDQQAMSWANNTRFTTQDVAGAINNAAHAGWGLEKIMEGVPNAMQIAMAGSMDLSQALELLVDISNAAGIGFENLGSLTDYWAYAANKSSTTIPEMGTAMQKMGATLKYLNGDMAGLTTMLAVLANNGTKGVEAGTLLRNSMIRLIAPTKAAAASMDGLELTADDLEEIYQNADSLGDVGDMLEEAGFSAYDAQGKLKNFITMFEELSAATEGMSEQDRNKVLSTIFPTRTITGALALLDAAKNKWDGLYDSIRGNGAGYAEYAAETMESGLGGTLRHLESVEDVLKTKTGDALSGMVGAGADKLSGLIESVNGMDDGAFQTLVGGLTGLAAAGPALTAVGTVAGALRLLLKANMGPALAVAGGLTAAATAMGAYLGYLDAAEHADFGSLELDMEKIQGGLDKVGATFQAGQKPIGEYTEALEKAVERYTDASASLKENLLESFLTGGELTQDQIATLYGLGDQIQEAMIDGIKQNRGRNQKSLELFSGLDGKDLVDSDIWGGLRDTLEKGYQSAITTAQSLSQQLREALTSAFTDGSLTGDEINGIQKILDQQNELIAMQAAAKNATERQKLMQKAQTLGLDGMNEISQMAQDQRDQELQSLDDDYWNTYYQTKLGGEYKIRQGAKKADGSRYTQADLDKELETLLNGDPDNPYDGYAGRVKQAEAGYGSFLADLYRSALQGSDLGDAFGALETYVDDYLASGGKTTQDDYLKYSKAAGGKDRSGLQKYLNQAIEAMGGKDTVADMAQTLAGAGDTDSANKLQKMLLAWELANFDQNADWTDPGGYGKSFGKLFEPQPGATETSLGNYTVPRMASADHPVEITGDIPQQYQDMMAPLEEGVQIPVSVDTSGVASGIQGAMGSAEGAEVEATVDGNTGSLESSISDQDGTEIEVSVDGDTSALESAISALDGTTITVNAVAGSMPSFGGFGGFGGQFAEGGRATEASIFGEVPGQAEWAIPEAHTQRTAELLDAAREASGFSWGELLSRNGGLMGGTRSIGTIIYSPTIHARDARGVERALEIDKQRLEKYLRERETRKEMEAYG